MHKGARGTEAVESGHIVTVGTLRTRRPGEGGVQGDFDHIVPVISPALNTQSGSHHAPDTKAYVARDDTVRRLTPVECERLQGFPDDFTRIPYRNKPADQCPDGPRYKALGNSMAVPVMRWIGERIQMVENAKC